jgi:glycerol-3-phosphate acyltransferase PlsY
VLVFALDFLKGLLPVLLAGALFGRDSLVPLVAAAAAVLGHVFPVWLGFRGGKGAAAGLGAAFGLAPPAAGVALGVFAATLALTRYVSLGSMLAAVALPLAFWLTEPDRARANGGAVLWTLALLSVLVIVRHRSNLGRLARGTENRLGGRRAG